NDGGPQGDVFLYDRLTGTTEVLTDTAHIPSRPDGEHYTGFSISGNGNTVVFRGEYFVTDPQSPTGQDQINEIYVYDRTSDTVHLLTNPADNNTPYNVIDQP